MARDVVSADGALRAQRSLLDSLRADAAGFRPRLGSAERPKLDLYLESVRDLEKGLGTLAADLAAAPACGKMLPPAAHRAPGTGAASFVARVNDMPKVNRLFSDVMAMALGCDITRVDLDDVGRRRERRAGGLHRHEGLARRLPRRSQRPARPADHPDAGVPGGRGRPTWSRSCAGCPPPARRSRDGTLLDSTRGGVRARRTGTPTRSTSPRKTTRAGTRRWCSPAAAAARWPPGRLLDARGANHNDVYLAIARAFGLT